MGLDIRRPLGLLFLAIGVLMTGYGALTHGSAIYQRSVGLNVNLWWGAVMLAFGALMYALGLRPQKAPRAGAAERQRRSH